MTGSPWHGRNALVTGAGGFIGSHLVEALLALGCGVRAFVRTSSRREIGLLRQIDPARLQQVEVASGDLRDERAVREAARGCQLVFHLGALVSVSYSYRHPSEVAGTNFMGTLNVLEACRDLGVERLVHTSAGEVYGNARRLPSSEDQPLRGQTPYAASKIGADVLVESFFSAYRLPVVTLRPFDTYGPRQSARALVPAIITQALCEETVHLGNVTARRDFTYVSDTVRGFLLAAGTPGVEGRTFNLGTGREVRTGELAGEVFRLLGKPVRIVQDPQRMQPESGEVLRLLSDNALAGKHLGWKPETSLEQGLQRTIDWVRQHLDLYWGGGYED
jgi:dTDP-glucose 4,6-dehydratase